MPVDLPQLLRMSQKELDELYLRSEAGPMPDGESRGTALIAPGTGPGRVIGWIARWLFWQGKVFDAKNGSLINRAFCLSFKAIRARVYKEPSWLDGRECIVLDYSKTSLLACKVRDEIREVGPGLYLGKVYWGRKRLIDFAVDFHTPPDVHGRNRLIRYGVVLLAGVALFFLIRWLLI